MSPFVLTVLKIVFLALLYFFVYRAIRSVVVDLGGPQARRELRQAQGQSRPASAARQGRPPRSVTVFGDDGEKLDTLRLTGQIQIGRASCRERV